MSTRKPTSRRWYRHTPPRGIAVLAEAGRRWPHVAERLYAILRAQPGLAVAAGGATLTALAATVPIELLEAIEPHLPTGRHVDLDAAVAAITQRLTDHRLDHTEDPATRAALLSGLFYRFANAGLHQQALAPIQEGVEVFRGLAAADPAAYEPRLATALSNLGVGLSALGQHKAALAASQEAVEIRRRLAAANPAAHEPSLARALRTFGRVRVAAGTGLDDALTAMEESIEIFRRLTAGLPNVFVRDLVSAYRTAADVLDRLGRTEEASSIRRQLRGED